MEFLKKFLENLLASEDFEKSALTATVTVVTALIAFVGVYYASNKLKQSSVSAQKLEQLKLIDQLSKEKAWTNNTRIFSIEEAFRLYLDRYIPFGLIEIFCASSERYELFKSFKIIGNLVDYDQAKKKVRLLSSVGLLIRTLALFLMFLLLLACACIFSVVSISALTFVSEGILSITLKLIGSCSILVGIYFSILAYRVLSSILDQYTYTLHMETILNDNAVRDRVSKSDILLLIVLLLLLPLMTFCLYEVTMVIGS